MNSPRTLLQINLSANVGSTGRIAEEIGKEAMGQGWRSVIAYGRFAGPSESELIRVGNGFDIKEHLIETRLFDNHGLSSRRATKKFIKQIEALKPDIIHLHNIHGYYLNYQILFEYLNKTNIPIVWTLHDCWAFTGHCGHFIMANCERWKIGCGHCPITHTEYPKAFIDRSARNYKLKSEIFGANQNLHIVTVSEWLAGLVRQSFLKDKDIRVINNGIDLNVFKPTPIKGDRRFKILGVSNLWSEIKGIEDYIKLSKLLKHDETLTLIGVDEELKKKLPNNIVCIPRTANISELVDWYNKSDVVLSLSKGETFGLTIAEAHACGTPTIVYDNSAQPELIAEGCGYIAPTGDVDAVYECIKKVKELKKSHFSDNCRKHAEICYSKKERYNDYMTLYKELLC